MEKQTIRQAVINDASVRLLMKGFNGYMDDIETEVQIGSNLASTTLIAPVKAVKNDTVRPQVTRNAGTSTVTVKHYSGLVR